MRSYPALRLGGEVFFCAAVLSFFAPFCRDLRFFWLLAAGILAVSLAAVRLSRKLPRLLLALLPGLAFLVPVSGPLSAAAGAAILLYAAVILTRGEFFSDFYAYRIEAVWILAVCGVFAVISFFWTGGGVSSFWLLLCAILLVLLALRMLQVGGSMGTAWRVGSAGILGAVLAAGAVVGLTVWALRLPLIGFFRLFATGLAYLLTIPLLLIAWFWTEVTGVQPTDQDPGLPKLIFSIGGNPNPSSQIHTDTHYESINADIPWMAILTVLIVVLLILAAIRLVRSGALRRMRKYQTRQANDTADEEARPKRSRGRRAATDNRSRLRLVYSRYLEYLRTRGVELDPSRTTQEITEASSELLSHSDRLLRELYRKARYSKEPISDEDLRAAEEQLRRLLEEERLRKEKP